MRVFFWGTFYIRVLYCIWDLKREPNLENYPLGDVVSCSRCGIGFIGSGGGFG